MCSNLYTKPIVKNIRDGIRTIDYKGVFIIANKKLIIDFSNKKCERILFYSNRILELFLFNRLVETISDQAKKEINLFIGKYNFKTPRSDFISRVVGSYKCIVKI